MPRPAHKPQPHRGFTLVEVLVALSILSIAVLGLMSALRESVINTAAVRDRQLAQIVAENVMVETMGAPSAPQKGSDAGQTLLGRQQWMWARKISTTSDPAIVRIEISVKAGEGGAELAQVTAFRGEL
jgi:general secretion pathway protein I